MMESEATKPAGRLPLLEPQDHPHLDALIRQIRTSRSGQVPNLYKTLLHSPPVAAGWLCLTSALKFETDVSPEIVEILILRVAQLCGADYAFQSHVRQGTARGVRTEQIEWLSRWCDAECFDRTERATLLYADHMIRDTRVPAECFDALREFFSERQLLELTVIIAGAGMGARVLEALEIPQPTSRRAA